MVNFKNHLTPLRFLKNERGRFTSTKTSEYLEVFLLEPINNAHGLAVFTSLSKWLDSKLFYIVNWIRDQLSCHIARYDIWFVYLSHIAPNDLIPLLLWLITTMLAPTYVLPDILRIVVGTSKEGAAHEPFWMAYFLYPTYERRASSRNFIFQSFREDWTNSSIPSTCAHFDFEGRSDRGCRALRSGRMVWFTWLTVSWRRAVISLTTCSASWKFLI